MNFRLPWREKKLTSGGPKPFRIGVWCDYGFTLTRVWGIGVFVYNLVEGLFALDEPIEVVMPKAFPLNRCYRLSPDAQEGDAVRGGARGRRRGWDDHRGQHTEVPPRP